ncbi:hypothetical protein ESA_04261 [Cronobacter sakazakii ATCC BAA-894]|uniref:Uncharacterized protein n=1 Tax=Cronobacter sakazakii (strain ATCC BAA-894) TaxID=290339 RepID=A7MHA9_CROS8|nr:hypothetical protein ESA_04261 [Cronobacter sakazakii ATCC BAA-894]
MEIGFIRQLFQQHIQQHAIHRQEEHQADKHLEGVVHQRDFHPVFGHERVRAAPEGDKEERQRIADVAEQQRRARRQPPVRALAQAVKHMHVEDLPERIGHKAGGRDARDEQIEVRQRVKPLPAPHIKQRGDHVGDQQRRHHHGENNATSQRRAKNAHGQIGGKENKRKAKRAPGGMKTKNGDGQLHQIVAGGDHQQMKQRKPDERVAALARSKGRHIVTFLLVGVREPSSSSC